MRIFISLRILYAFLSLHNVHSSRSPLLEDIFIITKDNVTSSQKVAQLSQKIIGKSSAFENNLISVTNLQDLRISEFWRGEQCLIFYYILENLDEFDFVFDEISSHHASLMDGMYKFVVKLKLQEEEQGLFDEENFKRTLRAKIIQNSNNFFQENPILVQVLTKFEEFCFAAYRIDNIESGFVIKDIPKNPTETSCFSGAVEALIDSKISHDFGGANLIVSAVHQSLTGTGYDAKFKPGFTSLEFESGIAVDILRAMQFILNFTVTPRISMGWGRVHKNSENKDIWDGAVADVQEGRVDLFISSTANIGVKAKVVDFNFATHRFSIRAFYRIICNYRSRALPLLAPFHWTLWFTILVWIGMNLLAYKFLKRYLCQKCDVGKKDTDFQDSIGSWGFNTICNQGIPDTPVHYTLRTLYYFQLLVALFLNTAFAGTLVSYLSVAKSPIQKVGDLLNEKYALKFIIDPTIKGLVDEVQDEFNSSAQEIFRKSTIFPSYLPVIRILNENLAYISDEASGFEELRKAPEIFAGDGLKPDDVCFIGHIPLFQSTQFQSTFVKKDSRLRRALGYSILKMLETGNVNRWKKFNLAGPPKCDDHEMRIFVAVGLPDLNIAYFVLGIGVLVSFSLVLYEMFIADSKKYKM